MQMWKSVSYVGGYLQIHDSEHGSRGKTVTTSQTYLNADKIYAELISTGDRWAEADELANNLEDTKATMLAQLTIDAFKNGAKTRVEAETTALASKEYQDHIAGMNEARKIANKAKVRWLATQNLAELRRSQESTRRQEMRLV